jgi:hypothetical protein
MLQEIEINEPLLLLLLLPLPLLLLLPPLQQYCAACYGGFEVTPGTTVLSPACRRCSEGFISPRGLITAKPTCTSCPGGTTTRGANHETCTSEIGNMSSTHDV